MVSLSEAFPEHHIPSLKRNTPTPSPSFLPFIIFPTALSLSTHYIYYIFVWPGLPSLECKLRDSTDSRQSVVVGRTDLEPGRLDLNALTTTVQSCDPRQVHFTALRCEMRVIIEPMS